MTDEAALVAFGGVPETVLVSRRVGNFEYSPVFGALYDQLWLR